MRRGLLVWLMAGLLAEDAWAGAPQQRLLIMDFKAVGVDADLAAQATALMVRAAQQEESSDLDRRERRAT
mgnify:CR=1 FL=1